MTLTMGHTVLLDQSILIPGETDSLATLLNETLYLLEKLIQHHLGYAVEHSLPDTGYQSSHLRIRAVFKYCLAVVLFQINRHIALHKARPTGPFTAENIVRRRLFL